MKKYLLEEKKWIFIALVFGTIEIACKGIVSLVMINVFDCAINRNFNGLVFFLISTVVLWFVFYVVDYGYNYFSSKSIANMNNSLRQDFSTQMATLNYRNLRKSETGNYMSWFLNDVAQVEKLGFQAFFDVALAIFSFIVGAILLLYFHWLLLVASVVMAVLIVFVSKKLDIYLQNHSKKVSRAMEVFSEVIKEQVAGLNLLQSCGMEKVFKACIRRGSSELEEEKSQQD